VEKGDLEKKRVKENTEAVSGREDVREMKIN